jgi:hypothetical protein
MPSNLDHFKNQPKSVILGENDVVGLLAYKRALEKLFFSEVLIRNHTQEGQSLKLLIELVCHFDLLEGVTHLKQGLWGQGDGKNANNKKGSNFGKLFGQLQSKNNFDIEIEECSILFNNCNVVIHKIYDQSIPEQFDNILSNLSLHYNKLFKNIAELPYEIFIPVLEETRDTAACEHIGNLDYQLSKEVRNHDYHKYWGLYFYSEQDALIYDLNQSSLISGQLYMLNL